MLAATEIISTPDNCDKDTFHLIFATWQTLLEGG